MFSELLEAALLSPSRSSSFGHIFLFLASALSSEFSKFPELPLLEDPKYCQIIQNNRNIKHCQQGKIDQIVVKFQNSKLLVRYNNNNKTHTFYIDIPQASNGGNEICTWRIKRERERESKEVREGNLLKDRDGFFCGTFLPLWETKWVKKRLKRKTKLKERKRKLTDGAGDEEARKGVVEKRSGGLVVIARDADHSRVLFPRSHACLLLRLRLRMMRFFYFFFRHFDATLCVSTAMQWMPKANTTFFFSFFFFK